MKKYVLLTAAFVAAISLTGCGSKTDAPSATGATGGAEVNEDINHVFEDADKSIDMDKVEGTDATVSEDANSKGELGDSEVAITDAKMIDYQDSDVLVVSFSFKNKTGRDAAFDGQERVSAVQGDMTLAPAVVTGVEGISCETLAQVIGNGEEITVQKAFRLTDTAAPITVTVSDAANPDSAETISKTFNLQ